VFEGFNTAMRLAGASTAEAEGAYTQLLQGLGSGVLRGQELNSILEQAPLLAKAIADEVGTTVGQLREFGKDGELSSDVVLRALKRVADEGASRLADSLDNPIQKTKDLQNAWQKFQIAISPILTDIGAKIQDFVAAALTELTKLVNKLGEVGQQIENAVAGDTLKNAQSQFRTDSARLKELYQVPTEQRTEEQVRLITALERLQKGRLAVINAAAGKPTSTAPGLANQTDPDKDAKDKKEKEKALYDYTAQNQAALAENQLALNRQVFENEMALSEQAYRQKLDYENKLAQLKGAQLTGAGARGIFDQTAQFRQQQQEYENQRGELENQIKQARLAVQEAQAGVGIAGLSAATTRTNG
ncbi:MAG: tape measure protein, partial [Prochlorococcaceae cyanobacterium]